MERQSEERGDKMGREKKEWGWSGLIGFQVIVCLLNILIHDVII